MLPKLNSKDEEKLLRQVKSGAIKRNRERELAWRELVLRDPVYQVLELAVCKEDLEAFCRRWYWIVHKITRKPELLVFNRIQAEYHRRKTRFDIILKYRKGGITTYKCAEYFHRAVFHPDTKTVILTHHRASTDEIFTEFVKRPYERLPDFMRPAKRYDNRHELTFSDTGSSFRVGTASARGFGAGTSPDNVHLSEAAKYDNLPRIVGDLNQAVFTGNPRAHISLESVACGENAFFQEWRLAREGRSRFTPHFFPWFIDETNRIPPAPGESVAMTAGERELARRHGLDDAQILFRRMKEMECRRDSCSPRAQEYPETDQEAFVTTGHKRFDAQDLDAWHAAIVAEKPRYLDAPEGIEKFPRLAAMLHKGLRVFKSPEPGRRYVIGSDIARGMTPDGDFSDAVALDYESCEEVAELHGRLEPDHWAVLLYELGLYYNTALVAPEANNDMGGVVLAHLTNGILIRGEVIYPKSYPNLYVFQFLGSQKRRAFGWHTNEASKILMINDLANHLQSRSLGVHFPEFLEECRMLQIRRDGSVGAPEAPGCHDDRVISRAIALQARKQCGTSARPDTRKLVGW